MRRYIQTINRGTNAWKFLELYGFPWLPIVGARHPAPTRLSFSLLGMLLAEHTQAQCSEREEEEKRGADTSIEGQPCHSRPEEDQG